MFIYFFREIFLEISAYFVSKPAKFSVFFQRIWTCQKGILRNFVFIFLLISFSIEKLHCQDFLTIKKNEITSAIANNDVSALEYQLRQVFLQAENYSKSDLIDFYLFRIKLYNAQAKYSLVSQDLDSIFKYDSTRADAYLYRIPAIKTSEEQLSFLQSGIRKVSDTIPLVKQVALIKISLISNYWELNSYYGSAFNKENALKEIPYAQGGCHQLIQLSGLDKEAGQLYEKKCFNEVIKNF